MIAYNLYLKHIFIINMNLKDESNELFLDHISFKLPLETLHIDYMILT